MQASLSHGPWMRSLLKARPRIETLESRDLLSYTLADLGTFGAASSQALALNARGQVLLQSHDASGGNAGFYLSNGRTVHIPTPPDGYFAAAPLVLANDGHTGGAVFDSDATEYPALFGQDGQPGIVLDGNGVVVAMNAIGEAIVQHDGIETVWQNGQPAVDLPLNARINSLNDIGIGAGNIESPSMPAEWDGSEMIPLPVPDGTYSGYAAAISSDGRIAGQILYFDGQGHFHQDAAMWDVDGFRDLGAFLPHGINRSGAIVADDGLRDASGFHPWSELWPEPGWSGQGSVGINDQGQIAGTARAPDGQFHAYLLTPDRSFELAIALSAITRHSP